MLTIYCVDSIVNRPKVEDIVSKLEGAGNEQLTLATLYNYEGDTSMFKLPAPYDDLNLKLEKHSDGSTTLIAKKYGVVGFHIKSAPGQTLEVVSAMTEKIKQKLIDG